MLGVVAAVSPTTYVYSHTLFTFLHYFIGMYGKLGHGNELGAATPLKVQALSHLQVAQIACGSRHTAIVTNTGHLYTWGDKEQGVTGHGNFNLDANNQNVQQHQYLPRLVERLATRPIVQISACGFHTAVVTDNHELFTWGEGTYE